MNARKATTDKDTKLFVLDTNVLMHDPTSLFRFEEHDVYLPMFVLEELDNNKKGMTEVARNARQASRFLDNLVSASEDSIDEGVPLDALGNKTAPGACSCRPSSSSTSCRTIWPTARPTTPSSAWSAYLHKQSPQASGHAGQ